MKKLNFNKILKISIIIVVLYSLFLLTIIAINSKSGKYRNSKIKKEHDFFSINEKEMILMLEKATREIIEKVIASKPKKVIALDKLFKGNDQLKTNTVLQMKDAGVEFKTI